MFLEKLFRAGQMWHEETVKTLQLNIIEFLQEETRNLPASAEMEIFYQQVAKLKHDEMLLEEKFNQLTIKNRKGN